MWWHVWSNHPTSTSICGCGDTSLFTWFLEWPAYALSHGLNPFYSTAMGYPHGINLLSNTGVLAVGIPLAPITWIFGPIATLNVALLLSPVLSGVAMFILLRRWVSWDPAAFVGGLFYGFSPLILTSLDYSHLNLAISPLPPLIVACLDEILIRQRRRPVVTGLLLGLLVTLQFFLSTELLLIVALAGAFGILLVTAYAAWRTPQALRLHARFAFVGLAAGSIVAAVLLAYPAWFALAGPAHLSGVVWSDPGQYVSHLKSYVIPNPPIALGWQYGFDGLIISGQYLGLGLVVVLLSGIVAWRRDLRLWFFAIVGLASVPLSLGAANPLFGFLPLLENILPNRFDQIVYLCVAIMLGIVVDHTHSAVNYRYTAWRDRSVDQDAQLAQGLARPLLATGRSRGWAGALGGLTVAGIALVPVGIYLSQNVPIPVQSLHVPSWFRTVAPYLGRRQVLVVLPDNLTGQSPMTWQAVNGMRYSIVDEGGPGGDLTRAGREAAGQAVIFAASMPAYVTATYKNSALAITPPKVAAVRSALHEWGVTAVVIPDQRGLLSIEQVSSVPAAAALITAATGQRPVYEEGAWVWAAVNHAGPPIVTTTSQFSECTSADFRGFAAVDAAVECITSRGPFLRIVPSTSGLDLLHHGLLMSAAADSVAVKKVEFVLTGQGISDPLTVPAHRFVDGSLAGWVANTDALRLPSGTYTLRSVAHDAQGAIGRSPAVTMRVDDRTDSALPPTTRVLKPTTHAQLSGTTYLVASASSELGLNSIEFRITGDGRTIVEKAGPTLFGWLASWNTRSVPNGTYTVSSVADGNTGLVTTSKGVVVEVRNSGSRSAVRSSA